MVVTVVVIVAAAFGLATLLRPLIPLAPGNARLLSQGDFVARGARQGIDWQLARPDAVTRARQDDKPLLIVVSRAGSPAGLQLDALAFSDPEMADQINRLFTPVRIDLDRDPGWESVILPYRRLTLGAESGFELLIAHPDRGLAAWTAKLTSRERLDFSGLADFLRRARQETEQEIPTLFLDLQREWRALDGTQVEGSPDQWTERMANVLEAEGWRFPENGRLELSPWTWSALLRGGRTAEAQRAFLAVLGSPLMDGLEDSFFHYADRPDGGAPSAVKASGSNAEAMVFCARLAAITRDPAYRQLALRMAASLRRQFVRSQATVTTVGDPATDGGGSQAFTIPQARLWGSLSGAEQQQAREVFGLDPSLDPRMAGFPRSLLRWMQMGQADRSLAARLRSLREPRRLEPAGVDLASTTSLLAAAFMEAGLLLEDEETLEQGRKLWERARLFRTGTDTISQAKTGGGSAPPTLSAYAAYADACLTHWHAYGDADVLREGAAILRRAVQEFTPSGRWTSQPAPSLPLWPKLKWPIAWQDTIRPSDASLLLGALSDAARILGDEELAVQARSLSRSLAPLLSINHPRLGSLAEAYWAQRGAVLVESRAEWLKAAQQPTAHPLRRLTPAKTSE